MSFGVDEFRLWTCQTSKQAGKQTWHRAKDKHVKRPLQLRIQKSTVSGKGLFTTETMEDGQHLGKFWGRSRFSSVDSKACVQFALDHKNDRSVLIFGNGVWHVVDVRGCPFEMMNSIGENHWTEANVNVNKWGECQLHVPTADGILPAGTELVWDYGNAFHL